MKKFLPIIIGVCSGIVISITAISLENSQVAYGDNGASPWNKFIADSETLDWNEVFGMDQGQNLYQMIRDKQGDRAERDSLEQIAGAYGLSIEEAKQVLDGTPTPILNNPELKGRMTQEKATAIMQRMITDFESMKSVLELQQEIEIEIMPSEIFANGDLEDSGFDLITDLENIEQVLFGAVSELTVGDPFGGALDSPIPEGFVPAGAKDLLAQYADDEVLYDENNDEAINNDDEVIDFGDGEGANVEVLEEDVCPADDPYQNAVIDRDQSDSDEENDSAGEILEDEFGGVDDEGRPVAASPGEWGEEFCPGGLGGEADASVGAESGSDFSEFKSLGSGVSGLINDLLSSADGGAGAGAGVDIPGFSANVSVCLTVETIKGSVSAGGLGQNGNSCIRCEIEAINAYLEQTLSHTLVPHKATGNIMESGKCKDSGSPVSINFVTIWNPVPTPPNNDLIEGKNVFAEWNEFANDYMPILDIPFDNPDDPELDPDTQNAIAAKNALPGASSLQILAEVNNIKNQYQAEAETKVKNAQLSDKATDGLLFTNTILREMEQMNAFLEAFNETYVDIAEGPLKATIKKPDQQ